MKCPCQKCEDRKLACHGSCDRYIAWSEERLAIKEKMGKAKELERFFAQQARRKKERSTKR